PIQAGPDRDLVAACSSRVPPRAGDSPVQVASDLVLAISERVRVQPRDRHVDSDIAAASGAARVGARSRTHLRRHADALAWASQERNALGVCAAVARNREIAAL